TKPRMSSRSTAPHHEVVALANAQVRDRVPSLDLAKEADKRVPTDVQRARGLLRDRGRFAHRVHLLLWHRQPQQQLLVGDAAAEACPRSFEADGLRIAQGGGLRQGEDAVRDVLVRRSSELSVVAEEVA